MTENTRRALLLVGAIVLFVYVAALVGYITYKLVHKRNLDDRFGHGRWLLVRNFNDSGGFFWQLYNVLSAQVYADKFNMELVVLFDSGLYMETRESFVRDSPYRKYIEAGNGTRRVPITNWFDYYFQSNCSLDKRQWIHQKLQANSVPSLMNYPFKDHSWSADTNADSTPCMYEWERSAFDHFSRDVNFHDAWNKSCKTLPYVNDLVESFKRSHEIDDPDKVILVGMHARLTDKLSMKGSSEDDNKKMDYEWYRRCLADHVHEARKQERVNPVEQRRRVVALVCSDEQPMIDFMGKNWTDPDCRLVFTNSIRSPLNTGGQQLDTSECSDDVPLSKQPPDCLVFRSLAYGSVHRGMKNHCSFQKGLDVLLDVMLLSSSNICLRSRGNVSNFIAYLNPSCKIVDMVDLSSTKTYT